MEENNLFERLKQLNLPRGKFAIFGSGPMCIRGWKDCSHDLDVIVAEDVWNAYRNMPGWELRKMDHGSEYLWNDELELWKDWKPGVWDIGQLIAEAEMIDDLPFVKLSEVVRFKELNGRGKDIRDIQIIREHLKREQES